jgi:hypothetical protein
MSEGIKCNNNYVCIEDIITFETIEDPNKCVSLGDGICTTCEGVDTAKKANYELFGRNPIKSVFNIDKSPQENESFWELLNTKCLITKPTMYEQTSEFYISEPDYDLLNTYLENIQQRIQQYLEESKITNTNASKFILAIYKLAMSLRDSNYRTKTDPKDFLTRNFKDILTAENCSSQMIHDITVLPFSIQMFLSQLSEAPEISFIRVAKFLDTQPQACLEAVLQKSSDILNKKNGGKRKTRKHKKRKHTKTKKSKRKTHRKK